MGTRQLPIEYAGRVYRPPSEASSLILQATLGCSYNDCTFCGMYLDKKFKVRRLEDLEAEIAWAKETIGDVPKIFLADGDALIAKADYLAGILRACSAAFPGLRRVSCYASPQALAVRSVEEMAQLRELGLTLYYLGIESGHDPTLLRLKKGVDAQEMIRVGRKAGEAGVKLSTMILLGVAPPEESLEHARDSARVVNEIQPRFVSTLTVTPVDGTELHQQYVRGEHVDLEPIELARELREFLANLELRSSIFRSNHASNYLSVQGNLPRDKATMVGALDRVLQSPEAARFKPEWLRGL